jgi:hypothetical protein
VPDEHYPATPILNHHVGECLASRLECQKTNRHFVRFLRCLNDSVLAEDHGAHNPPIQYLQFHRSQPLASQGGEEIESHSNAPGSREDCKAGFSPTPSDRLVARFTPRKISPPLTPQQPFRPGILSMLRFRAAPYTDCIALNAPFRRSGRRRRNRDPMPIEQRCGEFRRPFFTSHLLPAPF